jgi:hypothetical protein
MITSWGGRGKSGNCIHLRHIPSIGPAHDVDPFWIYDALSDKRIYKIIIISQVLILSVCPEVSEVEVVVGSFTGAWGVAGGVVDVSSLDGNEDEARPRRISAQIKYGRLLPKRRIIIDVIGCAFSPV